MNRASGIIVMIMIFVILITGCRTRCVCRPPSPISSRPVSETVDEIRLASSEETVDLSEDWSRRVRDQTAESLIARPLTHLEELPGQFWELSLDDAILIALQDTDILRSLGGAVVRNPQSVPGGYDPAIQSTDPNAGIAAALAQFDTSFSSRLSFAKNDEVFNNSVLGGGATEVREDLSLGNFGLNKTAASGAVFSINGDVRHLESNNPNLLFPHSWTTVWEATVRQPLLQGRGVQFNRIAGPGNQPGYRNSSGVIISQINHEISIVQFERNLRNMVNEIVTLYWQLDVAYKSFDAISKSRDLSRITWETARARYDNDLPGGEADREAQAREQFFQLQTRLVTALNGDKLTGENGVFQAEANLRRLLNLPQSGDRLVKPIDEPANVRVVYDWAELASSAIESRDELREQVWRVRNRELQLTAARHFKLPRVDAIATYRNNGFGDDLLGPGGRFSSALGDAASNDHGEWEFGLTYDVTFGSRQAYAGVRNLELSLSREKAVLQEMQRQIMHDLGSAARQVDQSYTQIGLLASRLEAARNAVDARLVAFEADKVGFDELIDAQQRLLDSEIAYNRAMANYELAKEGLIDETGRLLAEHQVNLER